MKKRIVGWFVLVPLCVLVVLFTLANRQPVTVYLSPLGESGPLLTRFDIPLFLLIYAMLLIGIVLGGFAVWFTQGRNRRERRQFKRDKTMLEKEVADLRKSARAHNAQPALLDADELLDEV